MSMPVPDGSTPTLPPLQPTRTEHLLAGSPLDHPIWEALGSRQQYLALAHGNARRYPVEVAPFGAIFDSSSASFTDLGAIVGPGETVAAFTPLPIAPPDDRFSVVRTAGVHQMIATILPAPRSHAPLDRLGPDDLPEILALVERAKPGPFDARTLELGDYLGIRRDGHLVAMAGERMKLNDFTEVSAVCTDPDYRGQGLSYDLVIAVSNAILAKRRTPFLHVFADNEPAIALYRKLGFRLRRTMVLTVLSRNA